jgi:hypothetical protein
VAQVGLIGRVGLGDIPDVAGCSSAYVGNDLTSALSSSLEYAVRRAAVIAGLALGVYLIARAVAEPFVIDMTDPATYRDDWGGPSLLGVLAVHCGPGLLAGAVIATLVAMRSPAHQSRP